MGHIEALQLLKVLSRKSGNSGGGRSKVPGPFFGQVPFLDKTDDFRNLSMSSVLIAMNVVANERA